MIKFLIRSLVFQYTDRYISSVLKRLNLKYTHDNNPLESEFFIKDPEFGLIVRYSKKIKGINPSINVIVRGITGLKNEFISLEDLEEFIRVNR